MSAAAERHLTALVVFHREQAGTVAHRTTRDALMRESYRHGVTAADIAEALALPPHVVRTVVAGVKR